MEIHDKLKMIRQVNKMTQSEIAEKLNMSTNGYAKLGNGETQMNINRLQQIAELYNMDILELMSIGEKNTVFLINENGDNNNKYLINEHSDNNTNKIGQTDNLEEELTTKIENLQLKLQHKDEIIGLLQNEIEQLKEIIQLMKKVPLER